MSDDTRRSRTPIFPINSFLCICVSSRVEQRGVLLNCAAPSLAFSGVHLRLSWTVYHLTCARGTPLRANHLSAAVYCKISLLYDLFMLFACLVGVRWSSGLNVRVWKGVFAGVRSSDFKSRGTWGTLLFQNGASRFQRDLCSLSVWISRDRQN